MSNLEVLIRRYRDVKLGNNASGYWIELTPWLSYTSQFFQGGHSLEDLIKLVLTA